MPATRSSTRLARGSTSVTQNSAASKNDVQLGSRRATIRKRAREDIAGNLDNKRKARNTEAVAVSVPTQPAVEGPSVVTSAAGRSTDAIVPAVLTFSLDEAKRHLISVDNRFEDIFNKLACKPFENLESFHPFQALATSILGQQISWLAAKSIIHKFKRLFDSSLPEKPGDLPARSFPTPAQVAATELPVLRTAGLSQRKAEYIHDLANRFADGRLSNEKILSAGDEDLAKMLIEVRGIGRWTVDMFAIFSLRRPDILPVGDLGVQRGLARWALALHSPSPSDRFRISPQKISQESPAKKSEERLDDDHSDDDVEEGYLPVVQNSGPSEDKDVDVFVRELPLGSLSKGAEIRPLPKTLTVVELRSRITGKKKVKGVLLTPQEMEELTESWKPYRSLGGLPSQSSWIDRP